MSKFRWMRTSIPKPFHTNDGEEWFVIKAIRSDGQPFAAWERAGSQGKTKLRKNLDSCINDPASPFVAHADPEQKKHLINAYKGKEGWVEEP